MQSPKDRPFTRFAAEMIGGLESLDKGNCPICHGPIGPFRDQLSKQEYSISGMCQTCQDSTFGSED